MLVDRKLKLGSVTKWRQKIEKKMHFKISNISLSHSLTHSQYPRMLHRAIGNHTYIYVTCYNASIGLSDHGPRSHILCLIATTTLSPGTV